MRVKGILAMVLAFVVLTGCATSNDSVNEKAEVVDKQDSTEVEAAEVSEDTQATEEVVEADDSDQSSEVESKDDAIQETAYTYTDEIGREVSFERVPERIAVTYLPLWESLILLDKTPIAVSGAENYLATWDPFQELGLENITDIGQTDVNLELLTELNPDLIMEQVYDVNSVDIENYEQIATVAVFGPKSKMSWRYNLREVAKVIGEPEKAEAIIEEVQANLDTSREKLADTYSDKTVMQMSLMAVDKMYMTYRSELYSEEGLGLTPPEGFTTEEKYEQISMEALVEMNPDVIFVNVFDGEEAMFEEFQENAVWQTLTAVKEGHVYRLDGSGHALSALSTIYTVDKIVDILSE